jgi:hypothetical protein
MNQRKASLGELFSVSWEGYRKRALPILAVICISTAVLGTLAVILVLFAGLGGALAVHGQTYRGWIMLLIAVSCVLFLCTAILALWCYTTLLAVVVGSELGVVEAFRRGRRYLWPMAWVLAIFTGLVAGGMLAGVLPALLFLVWCSFGVYILMEEDRRGMDAVLASREYVRGRWWETFGRLLVIWLLSSLIGIIPFAGPLLSIFFYPYAMLFTAAVYHDLRSGKGEVTPGAGPGIRMLWWIIAAVGLLAPLVALAGGLLALLGGDGVMFEHPAGPRLRS